MEITQVVERHGEDYYTAIVDGAEMVVPKEPANRHYQAIQGWGGPIAVIPRVNLSAEGLVVSVLVEGAEPPPASIDLDLGGASPVSVPLTDGAGSMEIVAEPPQVIEVRAADQENYYDAGGVTINLE